MNGKVGHSAKCILLTMIRRSLQRHKSLQSDTVPSTKVNDEWHLSDKNHLVSGYLNRKKIPRNRTFLKLWTTAELNRVSSGDNAESEFTLWMRSFEANFADGSKVYFRRDCFHRLLTVNTGSSVIVNDTPQCQSLSTAATVTSCRGTGLTWLSAEARTVYEKALEMLSHCEKLETTLLKLATQHKYLKLPFIVGRPKQLLESEQQADACIVSSNSISHARRLDPKYHPFHAYFCPYCPCDSSISSACTIEFRRRMRSVIDNESDRYSGVIEPGFIGSSSSGIASKSVSPPYFPTTDGNFRTKVELQNQVFSLFESNSSDEEDDEIYVQHRVCRQSGNNNPRLSTNYTVEGKKNKTHLKKLDINENTSVDASFQIRTNSIYRKKSGVFSKSKRCKIGSCPNNLVRGLSKIRLGCFRNDASAVSTVAADIDKSAALKLCIHGKKSHPGSQDPGKNSSTYRRLPNRTRRTTSYKAKTVQTFQPDNHDTKPKNQSVVLRSPNKKNRTHIQLTPSRSSFEKKTITTRFEECLTGETVEFDSSKVAS